ncbi:GNAT family N-acetyltransferase [Pluralibacter gergoviae]
MMNGNSVTIAPAQEKDYDEWHSLWLKYQEFYNVEIPDAVTKMTWQRFFNQAEPMFCAVAKSNGKLIGLVHYTFHRSTWAENNYCYLEDLYVCENTRGQHVGKQLIEYVKGETSKNNASRLYWHTHEENHRAQRLYDWVAKKTGMIKYQMPM